MAHGVFFTIGKILQEPTHPLSVVLFLLLMALFFLKKNRLLAVKRTLWIAFALLFFASNPLISHLFIYPLESQFPTLPTTEYPSADAIVVLGGSVVPTVLPRLEPEELNGTRLLAAAKLFKAGKASRIIVCGGLPYSTGDGKKRGESQDMKEILVAMGIPAAAIIEESRSRNTKENARYTRDLFNPFDPLKAKHILLVTSGTHLPRANLWFTRMGYQVTAVPSEHYSSFKALDWSHFVPQAKALHGTTLTLKEYLGLLVAYMGY